MNSASNIVLQHIRGESKPLKVQRGDCVDCVVLTGSMRGVSLGLVMYFLELEKILRLAWEQISDISSIGALLFPTLGRVAACSH